MLVPVITDDVGNDGILVKNGEKIIVGTWPKLKSKGVYSVFDVEKVDSNVYKLKKVVFSSNNQPKFLKFCKDNNIEVKLEAHPSVTEIDELEHWVRFSIVLVDFLGKRRNFWSVDVDSDEILVGQPSETGVDISINLFGSSTFKKLKPLGVAKGFVPLWVLRILKLEIQGSLELRNVYNDAFRLYAEKIKGFIEGKISRAELRSIMLRAELVNSQKVDENIDLIEFAMSIDTTEYGKAKDILAYCGKDSMKGYVFNAVMKGLIGESWDVAKIVFEFNKKMGGD